MPSRGSGARVVLGWTVGLYGLPVLGDLLASGRRGPFAYAAADAFYYLTVARNVAEHGLVSFDQQHPTNGFHPLWQYALALVAVVQDLAGLGATALLRSANALSVVLVALAIWLLGRAFAAAEGRLSPLFLVLPVGFFSLVASVPWIAAGAEGIRASAAAEGWRPLVGTLWLQTNAMETPLVLALYAWMVHLVVCREGARRERAVLLGTACLGLALARLDQAVFPLVLLAALLAAAAVRGERAARLVTALGIFSGGLALYLASNRVFFGTWLPVSGAEKTTFPAVHGDGWRALAELLGGESDLKSGSRVLGLFLPPLVGLAYLSSVFARPDLRRRLLAGTEPADRLRLALVAGAIGSILLAAYDVHFVPLMQQGTWYFPVSTVLVTLVVVHEAGPRLRAVLETRRGRAAFGVAWSAAALAVFLFLHRDAAYHRELAQFHHEVAPRIVAHYEGREAPRIASDEDGILAFSTGLPTLNLRRLALDAEAAATRSAGELLDLAWDRGFTRYSVGPQYLGEEHMRGTPEQVARDAERRIHESFRPAWRYRATVEFRDPTVLILRLEREG
jgi:hypothetical protein